MYQIKRNINFTKVIKRQTIGISEMIRCKQECQFATNSISFWYDNNEGYFWQIPVGNSTLNIGYWSSNGNIEMLKRYKAKKKVILSIVNRILKQYLSHVLYFVVMLI